MARHLVREFEETGHVVDAPARRELDVVDSQAVARHMARRRPEVVVHLAAVSSSREASTDPARTLRIAVAGTANVIEEAAALRLAPAVLVVSSSEVYGQPDRRKLPIAESARVRPVTSYALAKLAQESVAVSIGHRRGVRVAVVRPFNHTGPGQRDEFVVPALARRIVAVRVGRQSHIDVGNIDVRRDISDVRDVVRAYRLLVELLMDEGQTETPLLVNVASGRAVSIKAVVEMLCAMAGVNPQVNVVPGLVRADDPPEIRGDATLLRRLTGWTPSIPLETTLRDVLEEALALVEPAAATS